MRNSSRFLVFLAFMCLSINTFAQNAKQFYKTGMTFVESGNHKDAIVAHLGINGGNLDSVARDRNVFCGAITFLN